MENLISIEFIKYSHQPYFCNIKDTNYLFFCYCNSKISAKYGDDEYSYMPWSIAYGEWARETHEIKNIQRLETNLQHHNVECSPYFYEHEGTIYGSFIAGVFNEENTCVYNLYTTYTTLPFDLNSFSNPQVVSKEPVFAGFQNKKYQVRNWQELECEVESLYKRETRTFYPEGLDTVKRIIGIPSSNILCLITGRKDEAYKTFLYDLKKLKTISEILVDNQSIYKSCFCDLNGEGIIYAKQTGDFEERQLYYSDTWMHKF